MPRRCVHRQQQVLDRQEVVACRSLLVLLGVLDDVVELAVHRAARRRRTPWAASATASSAWLRTISGARPSLASTAGTIVSSWRIIAASRWSGVSSGLLQRLGLVDGRGEGLLGLQGPLLRVNATCFLAPRPDRNSTNLSHIVSTSALGGRRSDLTEMSDQGGPERGHILVHPDRVGQCGEGVGQPLRRGRLAGDRRDRRHIGADREQHGVRRGEAPQGFPLDPQVQLGRVEVAWGSVGRGAAVPSVGVYQSAVSSTPQPRRQ